jgi:EAL domain-containing protein (putative c-di-GMP-specific phosphodiesterase class I)
MAHDLGIRVVAEGVETKAQLDFLRLIECDEMQGYFFSKPLPPDELLKLLNEGKSLSTVKS